MSGAAAIFSEEHPRYCLYFLVFEKNAYALDDSGAGSKGFECESCILLCLGKVSTPFSNDNTGLDHCHPGLQVH